MTPSDLLTASRLKVARRCLREHKIRYLDGYRSVFEPAETRFGTLCHVGLEQWWLAKGDGGPALDLALQAIHAATDADPFDVAKAEVLLVGYDARWEEQDYEVLGVEVEFDGEMVNPITGAVSRVWRRGGKIDALVRERTSGRVLVVEHKTSGEDIRQGSDYWRRLRIDSQVTFYFEGGRILGHDVAGCLYDVIKKPGARPLKATPEDQRKYTKPTKTEPTPRLYANQRDHDETPEEFRARVAAEVAEDPASYFQRGEVARLEHDMREGLLDDWHFGQALRESIRLGRAPRNPDACVRYGRTCEFFDCCTGAASLDDESRFKRLTTAHPELSKREG